MTYTLRNGTNAVVRDADNKIVGLEDAADWQTYQDWLAIPGNAPSPAPPDVAAPTTLSLDAFFELFTPAQQAEIAASTDPDVAFFRLKALTRGSVSLTHPDTAAGLDACIAAGIIGTADKTRILGNQPPG